MAKLGAAAGLTALTAKAVGFAKASVDVEAKFSTTMNTIAANIDAPAGAMQRLNELAIKLGADTVFSAGEAADAMLELAKGGFKSAEIAGGGVQATMALAATESMDLAQAATIVGNAMNAFGLKAKDASKISGALAAGSAASSASVVSLAEGLGNVGATARQSGLSLKETVTALTLLDANAIKSAEGGTALRSFLTRLTPTSLAAKSKIRELGLQFKTSSGDFRSLGNISQQLQKKLGGLAEAQRAEALQTIFGSYAKQAASVFLDQGARGFAKYGKEVRKTGVDTKLANARMSGTAGALERLSGAVETAQLQLGKALAPAVQKSADWLGDRLVPAMDDGIAAARKLSPALHEVADLATGAGQAFADTAGSIANTAIPVLELLADTALGAVKVVNDLPGPVKEIGVQAAIAALVLPRLSGGITSVTSTLTMNIARLKQWRAEMTYAETRSQNLASATGRLGGAARTAAGIGGMVALTQSASTSNKALGTLLTTLGGAGTGFALAGPIGAAAGAASGLALSLFRSGDSAKQAVKDFGSLNDTLYETRGALTEAARKAAYLDLVQSGQFKKMRDAGLTGKQAVDVYLGVGNALKVASAQTQINSQAIAINVAKLAELKAVKTELARGGLTATEYAEWQALDRQIAPLEETIRLRQTQNTVLSEAVKQGKLQRQQANEQALAVNGLTLAQLRLRDAYRAIPKNVRTKLEALGADAARGDILKVVRQANLTPKERRIVFKALGTEGTITDAKGVKAAVENAGKAKPNLAPALRSVQQFAFNAKRAAQSGGQEVASTLKKGTGRAKANLDPFNATLTTGLRTAQTIASSGGRQSGNSLGQGIYGGVDAWAGPIASRAAAIVTAAVNAAKAAGKIKSPSQVMRDEVGLQLGRGIAIGLQRSQPEVKRASFGIVEALVAGLSGIDLSNPADSAIDEVVSKIESLYDKRLDRATTRIGRRFDQLGEKVKGQFKATDQAIEQWEKRAEAKARKSLKGKKLSKALRGINNTADRRSDRNDARQERAERALERAQRLAERKLTRENKADRKAALAIVKDTAGWLRVSAAGQAMINAKLEDAKNALDEIRQKHADYVAQVRDNVVSFGSVIGLGEGTGFGSVNQMIDMLRAKVSQARDYAELIKSLTAAGLNQTTIQQLIDAGVEGGLGTARAIASGGAAAIEEINSLTGELESVGTDLGTNVADNLYGAGITAAQGLVDGLTSMAENAAAAGRILAERLDASLAEATALTARKNNEHGKGIGANLVAGLLDGIENNDKAIAKAASKLGNALVRKVKEELQINSPSRVFRQIGDNVAVGLVQGIDARGTYVKRSASSMARTVVKSGTPALDAWNAAGGAARQQTIAVRLTADQVDQLQRGREIHADLSTYINVGGRRLW